MANKKMFREYKVGDIVQYYGKWEVKEMITVRNHNLLLVKGVEDKSKERVINVSLGKLSIVKSTFMRVTSPARWYEVTDERNLHRINW